MIVGKSSCIFIARIVSLFVQRKDLGVVIIPIFLSLLELVAAVVVSSLKVDPLDEFLSWILSWLSHNLHLEDLLAINSLASVQSRVWRH